MKVYIGNRNIEDESYRAITEPAVMNYLAEDSECTTIVLDGVLRKYTLNEILNILELCHKKLRIGGLLKIVDIDFDMLIYTYRRNGDIVQLNNAIFQTEIKSFLTRELVLDILIKKFPDLGQSPLGSQLQNIEFDMEFMRK